MTRVEVKMSDGKTHVSSSIPPHMAHLMSLMPPEIFAPKSLSSQVGFVHIIMRIVDGETCFCTAESCHVPSTCIVTVMSYCLVAMHILAINPLKCSAIRWLHLKVFNAIYV